MSPALKFAVYVAMGMSAFGICSSKCRAASAPASTSSSPVAFVYVQTHRGVKVYDANASGKLTLVKGSPFATTGQMEAASGNFLLSVGTDWLHSYPIESNGAVGKQTAEINTQSYGGAECGDTSWSQDWTSGAGSLLDRAGTNFYVQLFGSEYQPGEFSCAAWQSYKIGTEGSFTFLGDVVYNGEAYVGNAAPSTVPSISSNNTFGYGVFAELDGTSAFSTFMRKGTGELGEMPKFHLTNPTPDPVGQYDYMPLSAVADDAGHLAVFMMSENTIPVGPYGPLGLASYTIESDGSLVSTNKAKDMPVPSPNLIMMTMSPSGKVLAAAEASGLVLYHFNGAAPITNYETLLPNVEIDRVAWDNSNHLYALSYATGELYVYTVTANSVTKVSGSPYMIADDVYGLNGMVVVAK